MKDKNGNSLKKGQTVKVSEAAVKRFQLPNCVGVVEDAKHNSQQLVSVKLPDWNVAIDLHAKSLELSSD